MKKIGIVTTDYLSKLFWNEEWMETENVDDCMHVINIYPEVTYQKIKGFGGAFTEASATNYSKLSDVLKNTVIEDYYGDKGLRYNLGRISMNSCDFSGC